MFVTLFVQFNLDCHVWLFVVFFLPAPPGPWRVLFQVLCKSSDSGDSDWSLLAGRRRNAEGLYQQSQLLWSLQELTSYNLVSLQELQNILTKWMCRTFRSKMHHSLKNDHIPTDLSHDKAVPFFVCSFIIYWGPHYLGHHAENYLSCIVCGFELSTLANIIIYMLHVFLSYWFTLPALTLLIYFKVCSRDQIAGRALI